MRRPALLARVVERNAVVRQRSRAEQPRPGRRRQCQAHRVRLPCECEQLRPARAETCIKRRWLNADDHAQPHQGLVQHAAPWWQRSVVARGWAGHRWLRLKAEARARPAWKQREPCGRRKRHPRGVLSAHEQAVEFAQYARGSVCHRGRPGGVGVTQRVVNGLSARGANALGIERERGGDTDVRAAIVTDGTRTRARRRRCTRLHARCVGELEARYTMRTPKPHSKPHKGNVGRVTDGRPTQHICLQVCQFHGKPPIEIAKQSDSQHQNYFRRLASILAKETQTHFSQHEATNRGLGGRRGGRVEQRRAMTSSRTTRPTAPAAGCAVCGQPSCTTNLRPPSKRSAWRKQSPWAS